VTASGRATAHRDLIVTLATRHKLPACTSLPLLRRQFIKLLGSVWTCRQWCSLVPTR
jgi:hypothetical protein